MLQLQSFSMSLDNVIEGTIVTPAPAAARRGVRFFSVVDSALLEPVEGDPVRIRQISFNLDGNAIKFSHRGGVVIRADCVEGQDDGRMVAQVAVIDEGIGVAAEG